MASLGGSGTELRHLTGRRTGLVLARSCCSTAEMGACFLTCRTRGVESAPAGSSRRGRGGRGTSSECCALAWQASCAAEPLEEGRCSGWALEGVKQEDEDACEDLTCRTRGVESAPAGSSRRGRGGRGTSSECCALAWQASCAAEPLEEGRCSGWALEGVKQEDEDACEGGSKVRMLEL